MKFKTIPILAFLIHLKIPISPRIFLACLVLMVFAMPVHAIEYVSPGETRSFATADRCEGTPYLDSLLKGTDSRCVLEDGRAESGAMLTVSAGNSDVSAYSTVFSDFYVYGTVETVLDASVSADVAWNGVLFGAGLLGAGANVEITMSLVDETTGTVKGITTVVTKAQDSTGLKGIDVGGTRFNGSKSINFPATVVRGHDHSIRLTVTCNAESGLIGLDVGCIFFSDFFGLGLGSNNYARWTALSITVEQDIWERFDQIDAKLEQMDEKLDDMNEKLDVLEEGQQEIVELEKESIRLLLIPQGRRETDVLECETEDCKFPKKD